MVTSAGSLHGCNNGSWSAETTWSIVSGSLQNSILFDSSDDSPIDSDSPRKSAPLILKPPSPDSSPCEIKLYFSQKYDVRQIYVRSTARVYEIYYSQPQHSDSEYLCTVRCSIAERDGQVLRADNVEEVSEESKKSATFELTEKKAAGEDNNGPSEDDWVEIKVLDSPLLENGAGSSSNNINFDIQSHVQDYYEATVEISDSDPCTSLSIRFLSLQNKGCVYIDEVYAFAQPVGSIDSEDQAPLGNGLAESSLMSMLVPTLLQMSKSGISSIQGEWASDKLEKGNKVKSLTNLTNLSYVPADFHKGEKLNTDQQCVKLPMVNGSKAESVISKPLNQNQNRDGSHDPVIKNDSPYAHIEKVLEQLVSRVSKIEEVCLRFEENMLKPITSMEMRIQQVERQLESLVKTSQCSGFAPGTGISAPPISCESNSSSFYNDGSDCLPCRGPELEQNGMFKSVNAPQFLPSLVVTAPQFSVGDDEQADDVLESCNANNQDDEVSKSLKGSPQDKVKKIDNILAAALSKFLSSSSDHPKTACDTNKIISNEVPSENVQILYSKAHEVTTGLITHEEPPNYTQILTVTAPEFTYEENEGQEDPDSVQFPSAEASKFSCKQSDHDNEESLGGTENGISPDTVDTRDCTEDKFACNLLSISNAVAPSGCANPNSIISDDTHSGAADVQDQSFQESTTCSLLSLTADQDKGYINTDVCKTTKEIGQRECTIDLSADKKDVLGQNFGYNTDTASNKAGTAAGITLCIAAEGPNRDVGQNATESSSAPLVDFRLPILDVKFASYENSSTQFPLEDLLSDHLSDLNLEANSLVNGGEGFDSAKETNFIDMDDSKMIDPLASTRLLVDLGIYDIVASSDEESGCHDPCTTCSHEMVANLI